MSVYMRVLLTRWEEPAFEDLGDWVTARSGFVILEDQSRGWAEFELGEASGSTVVAGDLWTGDSAREEAEELIEGVADLRGTEEAHKRVLDHLAKTSAIVGLQILMSAYEESVAAANVVIDFLEQFGGVLTQVDTVGWYDGPDLVLADSAS